MKEAITHRRVEPPQCGRQWVEVRIHVVEERGEEGHCREGRRSRHTQPHARTHECVHKCTHECMHARTHARTHIDASACHSESSWVSMQSYYCTTNTSERHLLYENNWCVQEWLIVVFNDCDNIRDTLDTCTTVIINSTLTNVRTLQRKWVSNGWQRII